MLLISIIIQKILPESGAFRFESKLRNNYKEKATKKTLIIYASKTGTTQDAASSLATALAPFSDTYDCRQKVLKTTGGVQENMNAGKLKWADYGVVVLGTAMYVGKPMKELVDLCNGWQTELLNKKLLLFTCGVDTKGEDKDYLWRHLPNAITQNALLYRHLGGEIREDRMNFFSRMAMKEYVKRHGPAAGINQAVVEEISNTIKNL
jgi:menaquinone-dependent protoporphyrinogen oxidase